MPGLLPPLLNRDDNMPICRSSCACVLPAGRYAWVRIHFVVSMLAMGGLPAMAASDALWVPVFSRIPDQTTLHAPDVKKVADALKRSCSSQLAFAWRSARPADELARLAEETMRKQPNLVDIHEQADYPGRAADDGARLYLAQARQDGQAFTFLWRTGDKEVILQVCSNDRPPQTCKNILDCCSTPARGVNTVLQVCPDQITM